MSRSASDRVPANVLAAARRAGLSVPLWYVGRLKGPPRARQKTLADLARESRERELEAPRHKSTELLEAEHYARQAQRTTRTRLLAAVVRGLWAMGERRTTRRGRVLRALSHEVSKQVVR